MAWYRRFYAIIATRFIRLLQGFVLGLGAPIGWLLLTYLFSLSPEHPLYERYLVVYMTLGTAGVISIFGYRIGRNEQLFKELSVIDPLTQLYNAGAFRQRFGEQFAHSQRHDLALTLIVLDIDFFKRVNDTYGHQAGDVVLMSVAALLKRSVRESDIVARVGGEEFAMLLPSADEAGTLQLAERIRVDIANMPITLPKGAVIRVQVSQGVATLNNEMAENAVLYASPEELFRNADAALYQAKHAGRNRVLSFRPEPASSEVASGEPNLVAER